jgi:hypothetical protein
VIFWDEKKFHHVQNQKSKTSDKMKKTIISFDFSCDGQLGQKSACSIKNNSSVLQCKIHKSVVCESYLTI